MRNFTLTLFILALGMGTAMQAQDLVVLWPADGDSAAIANSQFDGGLNDWTTISQFTSDSTDAGALWVWEADGAADVGFFWGTRLGIMSPSAANGAVVFDSDGYDNDGVDPFANGFGTGSAPCSVIGGTGATEGLGHRSELISPSIDCSTFDEISLEFSQYFRRFTPTGAFVAVSNDGGATWSADIQINLDIDANAETVNGATVLVDITEFAANQADVRLRFSYQGCFYYWILDDVRLVLPPAIDGGLGDFFYGVNFATPATQIADDSVGFSVDLTNVNQPLVNTSITVNVNALDDLGEVTANLHTETITLGDVEGGIADSTFNFVEQWAPGNLDIGLYEIVYTLNADNLGDDFDPSDNQVGNQFRVTDDLYAKEGRTTTGFRPGAGGVYATGNMYRTSNTWGNIVYSAVSTDFSAFTAGAGTDGPLAGKLTNIYLMKVNDGVAPDFDAADFDPMGGFLDNPALEVIGFNEYTFTEPDMDEDATVDLLDIISFESPVTLEPNSFYFLVNDYADGNEVIFHGYNNVDFDYFQISTILHTTQWFLGGFGPDVAATNRLMIEPGVVATAEVLEETAVAVSPNPTVDFINVTMNFDEPTEAQIWVLNQDGTIAYFQEYDSVQKETKQVDASAFAAGVYMVHVNTPQGISTDKVVVVK